MKCATGLDFASDIFANGFLIRHIQTFIRPTSSLIFIQ